MHTAVREIVAITAGVLAAALAFAATQLSSHLLLFGPVEHEIGTALFVLGSIAVPFGCALLAWRKTRSRLGCVGPVIPSSTVRWAIVASYLLTWALGVPAVHTALVKFEVAEYKRVAAASDGVWEAHPRIEFSVAVPVLPFVILSYHEYQLAGLYGWGGWDLHFWSGAGATRIGRMGLWVS